VIFSEFTEEDCVKKREFTFAKSLLAIDR